MDKTLMYDRLHNDYVAIRHEWTDVLNDLNKSLNALNETRRRKAEMKESIQLYEYSAVAVETHKEGQINGSNAEKRKVQTAIFLSNLREQDSEFASMCQAFERITTRVDELEAEIQSLQNRVSFLRNLARMNAGLAHALAG